MSEQERIKAIVAPIAEQYGVKKISLFGSRARGTESEYSDYDFLISKGELTSLLGYMKFVHALEDAVGTHVDVVTDTSNDTDFLQRIYKEAIVLYERQGSADFAEDPALLPGNR